MLGFQCHISSDLKTSENVEFSISILFILELTLRLLSCTAFGDSFFAYIKRPIIIIDFISNIPFILQLALEFSGSLQSLKIIRLIRLIRMLRIFKLTRYLNGAKMFWEVFFCIPINVLDY